MNVPRYAAARRLSRLGSTCSGNRISGSLSISSSRVSCSVGKYTSFGSGMMGESLSWYVNMGHELRIVSAFSQSSRAT